MVGPLGLHSLGKDPYCWPPYPGKPRAQLQGAMPQGPEEREITGSLGCTERVGSRFLPHLPVALELWWCAEAVVTCATVISSFVLGLETGDGQGGHAIGPRDLEAGRDPLRANCYLQRPPAWGPRPAPAGATWHSSCQGCCCPQSTG